MQPPADPNQTNAASASAAEHTPEVSSHRLMQSCKRPTTRRIVGLLAPALCVTTLMLIPDIAPATVAEQRARLPPPAECGDPIAGVWRSHSFDGPFQQWQVFTLEINRDEAQPSLLTGTIVNNAWDGMPESPEPPPCAGGLHFIVHMDGAGSYDDVTSQVHFGGVNWRLDQLLCGSGVGFGYNLDQFTGVVDHELQEFQSVNNDGGRAVNVPTVFRRIECFDAPNDDQGPATGIQIQPPSFQPPTGGGCGRR